LRQARRQPRPPIPAEAIAALAVDPVAGYAADDWSWEARSAPKKETGTNRGRANPRCSAGVEERIAVAESVGERGAFQLVQVSGGKFLWRAARSGESPIPIGTCVVPCDGPVPGARPGGEQVSVRCRAG
jgi:hypothetical protein